MKEFKEFLKKKLSASKPMKDPSVMEARKSAIGGLKDDMASQMGQKLGGLKKVTVAAPDKEGLEEGLELAEDTLESLPEEGQGDFGDSEGEELADLEEEKEPEDMSVEELDAHIAKLEELKAQKAGV